MHNLFSIVKCRFIICLKANHKMAGLRVRARERLNQKCVSEQMFRFISFGLLCWWKNEYWLHAFLFLRRHVCQWNEKKKHEKKDMDQCSVFLFACYSQCFFLQKGCISLIEMVRWFSFVIVPSESPARFDSVEILEWGRFLIPSLSLSLARAMQSSRNEIGMKWNWNEIGMKWNEGRDKYYFAGMILIFISLRLRSM